MTLPSLGDLFGKKTSATRTVMSQSVSGSAKQENYAQPNKTNVYLARELYRNTNENYTLAAHLVRPIINNNANFVGIPKIFGNKKALKVLKEVNIDYIKIHKAIEIDGDVLIWPQWNNKKSKIELTFIPIECMEKVYIDPVSKEIYGYKFVEHFTYSTPDVDSISATMEYIITDKIVKRTLTDSEGTQKYDNTLRNPFGVLPIILFSNDKQPNEIFGSSEIQAIEPQLRFYHQLTYEAGSAQRRDGHPKLKVTTGNPRQWVDNNFGSGAYEKLLSGEMSLSLEDRDLFVNATDDDINYLYLNKVSGDFQTLSEVTFTNIVEGSEVPEINFGANIGTSLASVKEYRPVWIKKIQAKQAERTQPWLDLYAMIIAIHNYVKLANVKSDDIELVWEKPNFVSTKEQSEIVNAYATALDKLISKYQLSDEEAYETLKELGVVQIADSFEEHQKQLEEIRKRDEEKQAKEREKADAASRGESVPAEDEETEEADNSNKSLPKPKVVT